MSDLVDKIIADLVKGAQASEGFMRNGHASVTVARDGREEKLAGLGAQAANLVGRGLGFAEQNPALAHSLAQGGIGALGGALGGAMGNEDGHRLEGALRGGVVGGVIGGTGSTRGRVNAGRVGGTLGGAFGAGSGHQLEGALGGLAGSSLAHAGGPRGIAALGNLNEEEALQGVSRALGKPSRATHVDVLRDAGIVGRRPEPLGPGWQAMHSLETDLRSTPHVPVPVESPTEDLRQYLGIPKQAAAGGAMGGAFGPLGAAVGAGAQDYSPRSAVGGAMGSALGVPVGMVSGGLAGATVGVPVGMLVNLLRGQSLGEGAAYGASIGGFAGAGLGAIGGSMMGGSMGQNAFRPDEKQAALTSRFTDGARAAATAFGIKEAFLSTLLPLAGAVGGGAAARAIGGKVAPKLMARLGTGLKSEAFNQVGSMAGGMVGQKLAPPEQAG